MDYVLIKNIPSELWVCPLQSWFQTSLSLPAIEPPKWLMQRRDLRKNHSSALLIRFFPLCSNTAVTIERSACYLAALIGGITSLIANRFNRSITVCLWVDKTAAAHTTFSPSFGWPPRERSVVERITIKPPFCWSVEVRKLLFAYRLFITHNLVFLIISPLTSQQLDQIRIQISFRSWATRSRVKNYPSKS